MEDPLKALEALLRGLPQPRALERLRERRQRDAGADLDAQRAVARRAGQRQALRADHGAGAHRRPAFRWCRSQARAGGQGNTQSSSRSCRRSRRRRRADPCLNGRGRSAAWAWRRPRRLISSSGVGVWPSTSRRRRDRSARRRRVRRRRPSSCAAPPAVRAGTSLPARKRMSSPRTAITVIRRSRGRARGPRGARPAVRFGLADRVRDDEKDAAFPTERVETDGDAATVDARMIGARMLASIVSPPRVVEVNGALGLPFLGKEQPARSLRRGNQDRVGSMRRHRGAGRGTRSSSWTCRTTSVRAARWPLPTATRWCRSSTTSPSGSRSWR